MNPATAQIDRDRILSLLDGRPGYEFLNAALPALRAAPEDAALRLLAVREHVRLGLFKPARELLRSAGDEIRAHPEMRGLLEGLGGAGGVIPWKLRRDRFEANLAALEARGVPVEPIASAWSEHQGSFELYVDARSLDQVRWRRTNDQSEWWPLLADHRKQAESLPLPPDHDHLMPGPYLLLGVGSGFYLQRLWERTRDTFIGYSSALYVVEPCCERLAVVLHLHDWRTLLADERLLLFAGPAWAESLEHALLTDANLPLPTHTISVPAGAAGPGSAAQAVVDRVQEDRGRRVRIGHADLERQYSARDAAYWARRFDAALHGQGPPLRILATVSTHTSFLQYSMRDVVRAAQHLGYRLELIQERRPFEAISPLQFHERIRQFDPDLFFVIDHLRSGLRPAIPSNLPVMTWDQDALPHVFTAENVSHMSRLDTIVGLPHPECVSRFGRDPRQLLPSPMAASPEEFDTSDLTNADLDRYRCDVSYVSHGSQTAADFIQGELAGLADANARRLMERLLSLSQRAMQRHGALHPGRMRSILADAEADSGVRVQDAAMRDRIVTWHIWRICDRLYRHEALEWVADWAQSRGRTFRIYGQGWDKHPTLAAFASGPIQNGRDLKCLYRASRINLQLMPAGFIHSRALDGLLAGGFFLTRVTAGDRCDADVRRVGDYSAPHAIRSARELLDRGDEETRAAFERVLERYNLGPADREHAYQSACLDSRVAYAGEHFPDYEQIVFADRQSFADAADRFMADEGLRADFARRWRAVVIDRFSYSATLRKFLAFASDYFAGIAADRVES